MKLRSKNIIRFIIVMILQCIGYLPSFAANDPTLTQPLLGSSGQVFVNATSTVTDQPNPFLTIEHTHIINNMVSAGIEEESKFFIPSDFKATIKLHIITYNQKLQIDEESDKEFTIDYTKAEGTKYNGNQYLYLKNAYQVKVTITAIEKNVDWDVTKVLRIDNTLTATRDYVFDCFAGIKGLTTVLDNGNNELTASWQDPHTGLTEYDLEWAWVDESALASYQDNNQFTAEKIFNNNATRVTISNVAYNIPLLYDGQGRLFVRVRPAQIKHDGQRIEGAWTWQNAGQPVYFSYNGHENFLNWQASTSFAEEGKRKSVVQYFDGKLRNRQTVTKDNSTNTTALAESFYDYQGRPVIQVLPAPTLNSIIRYSKNFNKAINFSGYPKWAYDKLVPNMGICANPAQALDNTTGTSQYYSPNNEKAKLPGNNPDKYIPDAEGYPFTETRFTPDGRVAAQGGVGASHQLGSNHETKYIYEAPDQKELDALFGTDAGYAPHYFKNFVKDANGQYSVSYTDMHGRTVATALAGNTPENLDALPSFNSESFTKQLIDEQTNTISGTSILTTKALAVPKAGLYKFNYELNPDQFKLLNCNKAEICYDCLYNLKITITSDCNTDGFPYVVTDSNFTLNGKLDGLQCNGNGKTTGFFSKDFEVQLPEGGYTISKVLTLSDSAKNIYKEVFVANNTCKTFQDFYDTEYKLLVEKSNCELTCESCKESIGVDLAALPRNLLNNQA
ncbi:MAG: hypothetical protein IPJ81_08340 [Chitinophagaceae bacterium]|nr:hypothetical protein [Chitinophagaceae bacterium]